MGAGGTSTEMFRKLEQTVILSRMFVIVCSSFSSLIGVQLSMGISSVDEEALGFFRNNSVTFDEEERLELEWNERVEGCRPFF